MVTSDVVGSGSQQSLEGLSPEFLQNLYEQWKLNPEAVDPQWQWFFRGFDLAADAPVATAGAPAAARPAAEGEPDLQVSDLVHSYRELGHLIADLDPLGHNATEHPLLSLNEFGLSEADLDRSVNAGGFGGGGRVSLRELISMLRRTYCGTLAVEYMDIRDPDQRQFLQELMEPVLNKPQLSDDDRKYIMSRLTASEDFELFLQRRHPTTKRFSIEGAESACLMRWWSKALKTASMKLSWACRTAGA